MITECEYPECDNETDMPFNCSRCERNFCADHRLPENHACSLNTYNPDHQRAYFREKVDTIRGGPSSSGIDTEEVDLADVNPTAQHGDTTEIQTNTPSERNKPPEVRKNRSEKHYSGIVMRQLTILYHVIVILSIVTYTYGFVSS